MKGLKAAVFSHSPASASIGTKMYDFVFSFCVHDSKTEDTIISLSRACKHFALVWRREAMSK